MSDTQRTVLLIIPCYNEAARLDRRAVETLAAEIPLLFVDDGSTDDTADILADLCTRLDGRATLHRLAANAGKGEAVRRGMVRALELGAGFTGYADADFSTPPEELIRLVEYARGVEHDVIVASRVGLLGADIERSASRHYLGRVFATAAATILGVRIYDTQCGAKIFRVSPRLERALATPFRSRWAFDVELLGRLLAERADIVEVPLRRWRDVPGSKLDVSAMVRAGADLAAIAVALRRYGRDD